jgi:hypothetical protein
MNNRMMPVSILCFCASLLSVTCSGVPLPAQSGTVQVKTMGSGQLIPNYNGAVLQIGSAYRMTALAGAGYQFKQWIVATNWGAGTTKVISTLSFVMQPNLTLTAVFADTTPPTVRITNLAPNQQVSIPVFSNAVFTVKGTAQDNAGVSNVWYRLNGGPWTIASGTNAWAAPVALNQQVNSFQVFAQDGAGNRSQTNTVKFTYVATDLLTLLTDGLGRVSRIGFIGNLLNIGQIYGVKAVPGAGQLFAGWSGSISATSNPLSFIMQSNMVLQANFVPNPFPALTGDYNGLFYPTNLLGDAAGWANATNSGFFALKLMTNGSFSGNLALEGKIVPFSGALDLSLQGQVTVSQLGRTPLTINLELDPVAGNISGSVERGEQFTSFLLARPASTGNSNPYAGAYTLLVEGCDDGGACFLGPDGLPISPTDLPEGDSPATVKVSQTGTIQMSGSLSDGTPISQSTAVSPDGYWPLYVMYGSPYGGQGLLIGWLNFVNYGGVAMILWEKSPSVPTGGYFPDGFSSERVALVRPYIAPPPGQNAVNWTNGTVLISSGDLPAGVSSQVLLVNNQFSMTDGNITNLTITITPANGLFQGTFVHPLTGRTTSFKGAVMQTPSPFYYVNSGGGWFLGTNAGGNIRLFSGDYQE